VNDLPVLHHATLHAPGATPTRWLLLLHGVFGMGTNFRSFAQRLVAAVPDWGVVLVDLRGHGQSQGLPAPHDLSAAAGDLDRLVTHLDRPVAGIAGHSFGGKVTLAWLAERPGRVSHAVVLDSMPGARPADAEVDSATRVLASLEAMPGTLPSREDFRARLETQGYPPAIVDWLAMNLRRQGDHFALRLDLPAIRSMLLDYYARDLWAVLESPGIVDHSLLVIGGASTVFTPGARERAARARASNPGLRVETIEGAGHWVHVDAPDALLSAMVRFLGGRG
jgi:pimeloyl-ACP methyl ester carboxylesterase